MISFSRDHYYQGHVPMTPKKRILMRSLAAANGVGSCHKPSIVYQRQQSDSTAILTAAEALLSLSPQSSKPFLPTHNASQISPPPSTPKILNLPLLPDRIVSAVSSDLSEDEECTQSASSEHSIHPSYFTGCTSLALDADEDHLSPLHCFMRRYCVEAFTATDQDVSLPRYGKSNGRRIVEGQVGIRCIHCKHRVQKQERAVCFPSSLKNIYHSIETWQRRHSLVCRDIPTWVKVNMTKLMQTSRSGAGGRRQYWEESARRIGIADTDNGLRFVHQPGEILALERDDETISTAVTPSSAVSRPVVSDEDKNLVTGYLFVLLEQMEACRFSEQDRVGGRSKVKNCPVGYPGLQCRHCGGKAGFGRYFPASLQALTSANSDRNIYNHIMKCRRCPDRIREMLYALQKEQNLRNCKNRRGSRKLFFRRVWQKLHGPSQPCEQVPDGH